MRAAVYLRCSTAGKKKYGEVPVYLQNPEVQAQPLTEMIKQREWNLVRVYSVAPHPRRATN